MCAIKTMESVSYHRHDVKQNFVISFRDFRLLSSSGLGNVTYFGVYEYFGETSHTEEEVSMFTETLIATAKSTHTTQKSRKNSLH
jgi:hypothetical protein